MPGEQEGRHPTGPAAQVGAADRGDRRPEQDAVEALQADERREPVLRVQGGDAVDG